MYVCEILPLKTTKKISSLTYYTLLSVQIGDLVEVMMNGQKLKAIVVTTSNISDAKSELRGQDFKIKKITKIITSGYISKSLLLEVYNLSTLLGTTVNNIFNTLVPVNILPDIIFHKRDNTSCDSDEVITHHIFPTRLEVRNYKRLTGSLSVSTPNLEFLANPKVTRLVIHNESSRYYYSVYKYIDTKSALIYISNLLNIAISYTYDLPSLELYDKLYKNENKLLMENIRQSSDLAEKQINITKMDKAIYLSKNILDKISQNDKKIILYTLRKGAYTQSVCRDCSTIVKCDKCDKPYTLYKKTLVNGDLINYHICNTCHDKIRLEAILRCKICNGWRIEMLGIGTGGIEDYLRETESPLTNYNIYRIDGDLTPTASKIEKMYKNFLEDTQNSVLITTEQVLPILISNSADLVAVVSIDSLFYLNDYNIDEKIFFQINKLRSVTRGRLYLQTRMSDKYIANTLNLICNDDLDNFYLHELKRREKNNLPPYYIILTYEADIDMNIPDFLKDYKGAKIRISSNLAKYIIFIHKDTWSSNTKLRSLCLSNLYNLNLRINSKELL